MYPWIEFTGLDDWRYKLLCPICGQENTHHGDVSIYKREKEDGPSKMIRLGEWKGVKGNPSERRGAIGIDIKGECGHSWELLLIQHKGTTFLSVDTENE